MLDARDNKMFRRHAIASFASTALCLLPRMAWSSGLTAAAQGRATLDLREDGSANAEPGTPQMTRLLDGYRTRPPWKVAGVDYAVGVAAGKRLTDWRKLDLPGVRIDGNFVVVTGGDAVLDGIDFSTNGGTQLYVKTDGEVTIRNCRFGGDYLRSIATGIIDIASPRVVIRNCTFDGAAAGNAACILFFRRSVDATVQYCHAHNFPSRVIQLIAGGALDYRFNLIGQGAMQTGAHMNYLEFGSGESRPIVAFNTTAQTAPARSGGEGFQFYFNAGGAMHEPLCMNNTMIARGGGGKAVMSYLMHGTRYTPGITTTLIGRAVMQGNFLDTSSAYGAFYDSSFAGWDFHDNTDLVTQEALRPA